MPIYLYECKRCESEVEALQVMGASELACSECGQSMFKKLTHPALVFVNKYAPSVRREYLGTAPYTSRSPSRPRGNYIPQSPETKMEGEKWLQSIE